MVTEPTESVARSELSSDSMPTSPGHASTTYASFLRTNFPTLQGAWSKSFHPVELPQSKSAGTMGDFISFVDINKDSYIFVTPLGVCR